MVNFAFSKESQEEEEEEARSARESASFVSLLLFRYRALRSPSFYKLKKNQNGQSKRATVGLREACCCWLPFPSHAALRIALRWQIAENR